MPGRAARPCRAYSHSREFFLLQGVFPVLERREHFPCARKTPRDETNKAPFPGLHLSTQQGSRRMESEDVLVVAAAKEETMSGESDTSCRSWERGEA